MAWEVVGGSSDSGMACVVVGGSIDSGMLQEWFGKWLGGPVIQDSGMAWEVVLDPVIQEWLV